MNTTTSFWKRDDDNGVSYWLETQVTQNGSIRGGLSYSQISPDGTSLAFDDTNGHVKLVNFTNTVVNTDEFRTPASPEDEDGGAQNFYSETAQLSRTQEDAEDVSSLGDEEVEMIDVASILIKRQRVLDKRTKKIQAGRKFVKADMHAPNFRERDVVVVVFSERGVARQHSAATTGWQATAGR